MSAGIALLRAHRDRPYSHSFTYKDGAGVPINLTGFSAVMHLRDSVLSRDPVLVLSTGNGRIALGGTAGTIALALDADTMAALAPAGHTRQLVYQLELFSGGTYVGGYGGGYAGGYMGPVGPAPGAYAGGYAGGYGGQTGVPYDLIEGSFLVKPGVTRV